jgi:outer membrane lipoprotein LolB
MPDNSGALLHWHISGKVGIRLPDDAHSAYVEWTQHADDFDVLLFGPLGQGKSRLLGKPGEVQLKLANGDTWRDTSPEALLDRLYGWQLPVSRAQYWVKGLAAPKTHAVTRFNADGTLAHLEQDGWNIDYLNYQDSAPIRLPQKLIMQYDQVRVTLVVKQWQSLAPNQGP